MNEAKSFVQCDRARIRQRHLNPRQFAAFHLFCPLEGALNCSKSDQMGLYTGSRRIYCAQLECTPIFMYFVSMFQFL